MPSKAPTVRKISKAECPTGTLIGVYGDSHYGCTDIRSNNLMVECMEREGVGIVIPNGDIHDCGPVAPHEMKARVSAMTNGQLLEEASQGRPYIEWLKTKKLVLMGTGNHEDWINDVAVRNNAVGSITVASALDLPVGKGFEVLPHGYQIRLGSLVIEHGDLLFGRGGGGANLARKILTKYPDQSTIVNHFHRMDYAVRSSPDTDDIYRSHSAVTLGHMSDPRAHSDYAGRAPDWQTGFGFIRVWWQDNKPRYTITPVEIHRDKRGRATFEFNGKVYR